MYKQLSNYILKLNFYLLTIKYYIMKILKCLVVFSLGLFMFSCSTEESGDIELQQELESQQIYTRNTICTNPEPVNYTVSGSQIIVNSLNDPTINFIAVHKASNFAYQEALCDFWNGGAPDCGPNLTSGSLANDDYLLKVSNGSGFCWIEFEIDDTGTGALVELTSSGGTINVSSIDASVTRVDIHNLDYSVATPVSSICNPWSTICNAPISKSGFTTGSRLLRIEQSDGTVTFESITVN